MLAIGHHNDRGGGGAASTTTTMTVLVAGERRSRIPPENVDPDRMRFNFKMVEPPKGEDRGEQFQQRLKDLGKEGVLIKAKLKLTGKAKD